MSTEDKSLNFLEQIIEDNIEKGFSQDKLRFRFPPEPNGYLHIGHAKSICLNFGLGLKYNAPVNLRFDDTNPAKEEQEYVDAIKEDLQWLGFKWAEERYASDYFQQLYNWAVVMIQKGKAYVDSQDSAAMAIQKGTPTSPGTYQSTLGSRSSGSRCASPASRSARSNRSPARPISTKSSSPTAAFRRRT